MIIDISRAMPSPSYLSRIIAMLSDRGAAAPNPHTTRAPTIQPNDGAMLASPAPTMYRPMPTNNGPRRPYRSLTGPYSHGPAARPRKKAVMIQPTCDESSGMPNSVRMSAKAGNIRSMARAPIAINDVTSAMNSRRPATGRSAATAVGDATRVTSSSGSARSSTIRVSSVFRRRNSMSTFPIHGESESVRCMARSTSPRRP